MRVRVSLIDSQPSQPDVVDWDGSVVGTANATVSLAKYDAMVEANGQAVVNIFKRWSDVARPEEVFHKKFYKTYSKWATFSVTQKEAMKRYWQMLA